jgi:hypothetical protein
LLLLLSVGAIALNGQNTGCKAGIFGVDGGLYSNRTEFPTETADASSDWFFRGPGTGNGVIDTLKRAAFQLLLQGTGNPLLEARMNTGIYSKVDGQVRIDAVFGRDMFGGTGAIDLTSFETASKNGEDPAVWDPGPQNVLGKNDMIDVAGHMFRDGENLTDDLWFVGMINRAEPGGAAYMDFEFFVEAVGYREGAGFTTGGPDLGHTAFRFASNGSLTKIGDLIFTLDLLDGGIRPDITSRIWVSRADYNYWRTAQGTPGTQLPFRFEAEFDGATATAAFGYARITALPTAFNVKCGYVNMDGQLPAAPPWGTKNTKSHVYGDSYIPFSVSEMGLNLTLLGIDPVKITGASVCNFPYITFMIKTRASAAFTAQLKDFAGPYKWGVPDVMSSVIGKDTLSCSTPEVTLVASPLRDDCTYYWSTTDGNIISDPSQPTIRVDQPGIYTLNVTLPTGCPFPASSDTVYYDAAKGFFSDPVMSATVSCSGSDGTAEVQSISGGNSPYSYAWSNGGNTRKITGLAPGRYKVTISDASTPNACSIIDSVDVAPATPLVFGSPAIQDVACFGEKTGSITGTIVASGKGPYTYLWSNGNTSANISNLGAGDYRLTVTDADGCPHLDTFTVSQPASGITAAIIAQTDDTDADLNVGNGTINLGDPSGGTAPYTYKWSGPGTSPAFVDTDQDPQGLKYGQHTVTITDDGACTFVVSTFIYEPEICDGTIDNIDNDGDGLVNCADPDCTPPAPTGINNPVVCVGETVEYTASGPLSPPAGYSYEWTIPDGAEFVGASSGVKVMVKWNTNAGGKVCVRGKRFSCTSAYYCVDVSPDDVPVKPTDIIIRNNEH